MNMKTAIIAIDTGNLLRDIYACGDCFTEVNRKDKFCSNCGIEFKSDREGCHAEVATNYGNLKRINEEKPNP